MLEMGQYCDVLQYIMFQCMYQYLIKYQCIDISMHHCVSINKMFCVIHKVFKNDILLKMIWEALYTMVISWFYTWEDYIAVVTYHRNAQVYSNTLVGGDVSIHYDTFGMMNQYSYTLYHPISSLCTL